MSASHGLARIVWLGLICLFASMLWALPGMAEAPAPKAIIETKFGNMELEFFSQKAPKHVENFIKLAKSGFYDGTIFHGSSTLNRGHAHQRSMRRFNACEGRPRCFGGVQRGGGT